MLYRTGTKEQYLIYFNYAPKLNWIIVITEKYLKPFEWHIYIYIYTYVRLCVFACVEREFGIK